MTVLDENEDWPRHGTYEYSSYVSNTEAVVSFEGFRKQGFESFDFVVIGAGPIGAALAYKLSQDWPTRRVLIVEKSWQEPDRIVGELMQPSGCEAMEKLGLGGVFSGIGGVAAHGYYVSYGGSSIYVPYPQKKEGGRYCGVSFHHGRFVMNLRAACKAQRNITCVEGSVEELLRRAGVGGRVWGVRVGPSRRAAEGEGGVLVEVGASVLTFVCDGITSQFRRQLNPAAVTLISHFCGLVLEHDPITSREYFGGPAGATTHVWRAGAGGGGNVLPMPHNGNVLLDGVGPVLLYQMSERETRVLADIPGEHLPSEAGGRLREVLRESLSRAAPKDMYPGLHGLLLETLEGAKRIRCIGSKFIPATANSVEGAVWIGDALNVRHPLTGGGMTVGLWDVVILTDSLKAQRGLSVGEIGVAKAKWQWSRRPRALVVNVLSVALYSLFAAETKELGLLREACFNYLGRGE
ncbi:Squalene epoxidase [Coemansia sp. RSA 552]|nr:Squalene epoxidase [Coemansia sp. RSA 552]